MVIFGHRGGGGGSNPPKIPKLPFIGKIFKFQGGGVRTPGPPPPLDPRMTLKGKTFRKWTSGQSIINLKKKLTPGFIPTISLGYIHVYMYAFYSQTYVYWYISQISGERFFRTL